MNYIKTELIFALKNIPYIQTVPTESILGCKRIHIIVYLLQNCNNFILKVLLQLGWLW